MNQRSTASLPSLPSEILMNPACVHRDAATFNCRGTLGQLGHHHTTPQPIPIIRREYAMRLASPPLSSPLVYHYY